MKILSMLLSSILAASTIITVSAAKASDFSDMPDDWSTPALTAAIENDLLAGSDGLILPKDNLTRAQMATIIVRAFNASTKASLEDYSDVPSDKWYYEYMQKAVAMGVFTGDGSGLLTPEENITREQVFIVLARAFRLADGDVSELDKFSDADSVSSWAKNYTAALVSKGFVNGSDGMLNPKNNITRAEFAQIMYNMIKTYIDDPATLKGEYEGNVIIRSSNVTITKDAKIGGILVICEGCENVVIESGARMSALIDNRRTSDTGSESGKDDENDKDKDDDIFWVVGGDTSDKDGEDHPNIGSGSDIDDEGWTSGIYRP